MAICRWCLRITGYEAGPQALIFLVLNTVSPGVLNFLLCRKRFSIVVHSSIVHPLLFASGNFHNFIIKDGLLLSEVEINITHSGTFCQWTCALNSYNYLVYGHIIVTNLSLHKECKIPTTKVSVYSASFRD